MELLYIWIENFRNIKESGFNFSSQGRFEYNKEKSELTFNQNENFISEFFHKDITNITGIVGRNGTGKSNILELINYIFRNANTAGLSPFFFLIEENKVIKCYTYLMHAQLKDNSGLNIKFLEYKGNHSGFTNIYFSNVFDNRKNYFAEEIIDLSTNKFGWNKYGENIHSFQQREIRNQIRFINSKYFNKIKNEDFRVPQEIILSSPLWVNLKNKTQKVERKYGVIGLDELYRKYQPRFRDAKSDRSFHYFTSFLIFINVFFNPIGEEVDEEQYQLGRSQYHLDHEQIKNLNFIVKEILDGEFDIRELHYFIITTFGDFLQNNIKSSKYLVEFLKNELNESFSEGFIISKKSKGTHSKGRLEFIVNFNNKSSINFLKAYFEAIGDVTLYNFEWSGISSGEKAFLSLFSRFHSIIRRVRQKNVLICIDEGDLYFHPKWQKEFLSYLINVLPEIFGDRKLQIILSTHSPFLVSDLPKPSLIFLDVTEFGICSVKNTNEIDVETFGGNKHTLYTKTFFLEDGTISEFAYNKLIELQKLIKENKSSSKIQKIINLIGEPILKNQFEKSLGK